MVVVEKAEEEVVWSPSRKLALAAVWKLPQLLDRRAWPVAVSTRAKSYPFPAIPDYAR